MSQPEYDVFLSHNRKDKPGVELLAERLLEDYGLRSWVDTWALVAAEDWEKRLQTTLASSRSCAVFLGENGWGEYHLREAEMALRRQKDDPSFRVIPVMLPKADEQDLAIPGEQFARAHRVDFRLGFHDDRAYQQFVAAVHGRAPGPPLMSVYRIVRDAERWEQAPRGDRSRLYRGRTLQEAQRIAQETPASLDERAVRFLSLSAQEEQKAARRRNWMMVAVLAIVASLAVIAWWQRTRAVAQARIALARQLAAQAETTRDQDLTLLSRSVLLAVEAVRRHPSFETTQALRRVLLLPRQVRSIPAPGNVRGVVTLSPDGTRRAVAKPDLTVRISRLSDDAAGVQMRLSGVAHTLAYSPDGKFLAATGPDGFYEVFDAESGREVMRLRYEPAQSVALSADGASIATAGDHKTIEVRAVRGSHLMGRFTHRNMVNSVAFSADGRLLATGADDGTARLWDLVANEEVARFHEPHDVQEVAFSADSRRMAAAANEAVDVWDVRKRELISRIALDAPARALAFSRDGRLIAAASASGLVRVWVVESAREVTRALHQEEVTALVFLPDGRHLWAAAPDGHAILWDTIDGDETARIFHNWAIWGIAFSPDGRWIATGSDDATVGILDAATGAEIARIRHPREVKSIAYSTGGNYLIAESLTDHAEPAQRIFRVSDRREVTAFASAGPIKACAFSPDDRYLFTTHGDGTARLWQVATQRQIALVARNLVAFAFRADGRFLTAVDATNRVWGWELPTARPAQNWKISGTGFVFTADGESLASVTGGKVVTIRESSGGRTVATVDAGADVESLVFSPDARIFAAITADDAARLWETGTARPIGNLVHGENLNVLVFSRDGRHAATAGMGRTLRIWEVAAGREIARVVHDDRVTSASFSPDGRSIAVGGMDGMGRVLVLQPRGLTDSACGRLTRNLTQAEWSAFIGGEKYSRTCEGVE